MIEIDQRHRGATDAAVATTLGSLANSLARERIDFSKKRSAPKRMAPKIDVYVMVDDDYDADDDDTNDEYPMIGQEQNEQTNEQTNIFGY